MSTYQLTIITPNGSIFDEQITTLRAPGRLGQFGILKNHTPIVIALTNGILKITKNNQDIFYAISKGILEVNSKGETLILCDDAQKANTMDEAKELYKNYSQPLFHN